MLTSFVFGISYTWLWLWIAVAFTIIESLTLGIVSIWFALGAIVAMLFAFVVESFFIQLVIFLCSSLILVATTRKIAVEKLKIGQYKTNIDDLIGKECIVIKPISGYEAGEVKIEGKIWRAISDSKQSYAIHDVATVLRIEGVTIIVK